MRRRSDRSRADWNDLIDLLRRVRDGSGMTLSQAQQLFAAAPDDPLSNGEIQNMVAVAISRLDKNLEKSWGELLAGLLLTAEITGVPHLASYNSSDLVGLHSWNRTLETRDLDSFSVDSFSVDADRLRMPPLSREMRLSRISADPVSLDVWAGLAEPGSQPCRSLREGTERWHARLEADGCELGHCGVSHCAVWCPPWSESADYNDEVMEEIRRN